MPASRKSRDFRETAAKHRARYAVRMLRNFCSMQRKKRVSVLLISFYANFQIPTWIGSVLLTIRRQL
jgi:hypothetical protein